jgi:MFS family permease
MLEFFDYFLIGFVLAFIVGPWELTFGQSAIVLLSSGIGAILGAAVWGRLAHRIGRRAVFIGTVLNFSIATGVLAMTPDHGWVFLTIFRFFVGFGVGGLYCVDLPLVQEFMPASKRGFVGGLVTAFIPLGVLVGSILGAYLAPFVGWRGLFACGLVPALLCLLIRAWVPESPRWLVRLGRPEEARRSLAWALQVSPETLPLPVIDVGAHSILWAWPSQIARHAALLQPNRFRFRVNSRYGGQAAPRSCPPREAAGGRNTLSHTARAPGEIIGQGVSRTRAAGAASPCRVATPQASRGGLGITSCW